MASLATMDINSLRPGDAYVFDAKPLTEPMLTYCLIHPWVQSLEKFESKFNLFLKTKLQLKTSGKCHPFCQGANELRHNSHTYIVYALKLSLLRSAIAIFLSLPVPVLAHWCWCRCWPPEIWPGQWQTWHLWTRWSTWSTVMVAVLCEEDGVYRE